MIEKAMGHGEVRINQKGNERSKMEKIDSDSTNKTFQNTASTA